MGIAGSSGKLKGFQTGAWIFNMKNRFSWRDRQEIVLEGELIPWSDIETDDDE
jgi:hypothetical protein